MIEVCINNDSRQINVLSGLSELERAIAEDGYVDVFDINNGETVRIVYEDNSLGCIRKSCVH